MFSAPNSGGVSAFKTSNQTSANRISAGSDSGGASNFKTLNQTPHFDVTPRSSSTSAYKPRYKSRGLDRQRNNLCNFCGMEGHFERECDLRSILDMIKDYEHRILERRNRTLNGQVHNLEEPSETFEQDQTIL